MTNLKLCLLVEFQTFLTLWRRLQDQSPISLCTQACCASVTMHDHKWKRWAFSLLLPEHNVQLSKHCRKSSTALLLWDFKRLCSWHRYGLTPPLPPPPLWTMVAAGLSVGEGEVPSSWTAAVSRAKSREGCLWTYLRHSWRLPQITGQDLEVMQKVLYQYSGLDKSHSVSSKPMWDSLLGAGDIAVNKTKIPFLWNLHKVRRRGWYRLWTELFSLKSCVLKP